jgi:hypothetical protein
MSKGIEVELIRSHENRIIIRYDNEVYNLVGDNISTLTGGLKSRRIKKRLKFESFFFILL